MRIIFGFLVISLMLSGCATNKPIEQRNEKITVSKHREKNNNSIQINTSYDEFKGETISTYNSTDSIGKYKNLAVSWQINTDGKERINETSLIRGIIQARSSEWMYLNCKELILLIDGERYPLAQIRHQGIVMSHNSVIEVISYILDLKTANRISLAKIVKGQLCWNEFLMSDNDKKSLKTILTQGDIKRN